MKPLVKFNAIHKAKSDIDKLLVNYQESIYKIKNVQLSIMTKKILKELVSRDTKEKELKKVAYRLDPSFFDEVFENFLSLNNKEQLKFIELLAVYKKRIFKSRIYQLLLLNYSNTNVKKMAYLLTDKYKPNILQIPYLDFIDIIETVDTAYNYYIHSGTKGFFRFIKNIDPTYETPLAVNVIKSLLQQSHRNDYLIAENDLLYNFLVNHYNDVDGAKYGLHYLSIFDVKSYDKRILSFIMQCKNNIKSKYKELATELDLLLYKIYEYSLIYDDYVDIVEELAISLTDKIISEAFGDDERSLFWKQYTSSITEPIVFLKSPVPMFMMKFKTIGIIEYIDVGNATYLYNEDEFHRIKNKILSSASNEKNILNINSRFRQHTLKEITKVGVHKYIHRGSWKSQFKADMQRKYGIRAGI